MDELDCCSGGRGLLLVPGVEGLYRPTCTRHNIISLDDYVHVWMRVYTVYVFT